MRWRTSSSLTWMPSALGFGERRLLVDHLLQDLLIDAELLQQLLAHVAAVRGPVGLQLRLVGAAELARRDRPAFDARDRVAGGGVGAGCRAGNRECRR